MREFSSIKGRIKQQTENNELHEQVQQMNDPWQIDEDELSPQMQQRLEIERRQIRLLQQRLKVDQRELLQKNYELVLSYERHLLDSKLTSFINFLYGFFSEEQRNEVLAALHRLEKSKASKWVIRYQQIVFLLELIWANIQMKFDNIWLPRKNQRVDK